MAFIKYAEKDGTIYDYNPRSVADQFSTSTTYAVGDYAYYDGILYCFNTAHPAGAWNAAHVNAVTVGAEISELKADLTQLDDKIAATQITNTASGAIASFDDGADGVPVKDLVVDIEPVQDLHGQANPYPAGGGKNLYDFTDIDAPKTENTTFSGLNLTGTAYILSFDIVGATRGTTGNTDVIRIHCTDDTDVYGDLNNIKRVSDNVTLGNSTWPVTGRYYIKVEKAISWISFYWRSNSYLQLSAGACKNIMLEAGSSPTAYAPYENICPISGWTGANVARTGVNIFDGVMENGDISEATGQNNGTSSSKTRSKNYIPALSGMTLHFHLPGRTGTFRVYYYDKDKNYIKYNSAYANDNFTIPLDNVKYIRFRMSSAAISDDANISINYPSTVTGYLPYQGNTCNVDWTTEAGTVYGGTLDVTSGVLTVTKYYRQATAEYLSGISESGYTSNVSAYNKPVVWFRNFFYSSGSPYNPASRRSGGIYAKCNAFLVDFNSNRISSSQDRAGFIVDGETINSVATFISAVEDMEENGGGLYVCYELKTPVTYQLTPTEVSTLLGQNSIWADTGDVEVEYRADPKLYVDGKISATQNLMELIITTNRENSMTASKAYTAGELVIINGTLYIVASDIASGATFTPGTNVTATTIAAQLAALA